MKLRGKRIFLLSLFILLIFVMAYSAGTGVISISVKQVFQVIYSRLLSKDLGLDQSLVNIIMNIRLPRIIMGMIVGMGLGAAEAILLIAADTLALNIIAPKILPVGVLTAFIGSPLFVFMILKNRRVR